MMDRLLNSAAVTVQWKDVKNLLYSRLPTMILIMINLTKRKKLLATDRLMHQRAETR